MAATYTPIATNTLGSAQSSVTFSSISGSYTDLILIMNLKGSTASYPLMELNADTASNYSSTWLTGDGSLATSARYTASATGYMINYVSESTTDFDWNGIYHFQNYSNATTFKTILGRVNRAGRGAEAGVMLWKKTPEAITSIKIKSASGNFEIGSTFTLYGIKAA